MARLRVGDIEIDGANISIGGVPQVPPAGARSAAAGAAPGPDDASAATAGGEQITTAVTTGRGVAVAITRSGPASRALVAGGRGGLATGVSPGGAGVDGLAGLPIGVRTLVVGGGALAAAGGILLALTAIAAAAMLVATGLGAMALGALKRGALLRRDRLQAADAERELAVHADTLRPLLADSRPEQTVEWAAAKAALPEATVIRTLAYLRDRGEVTEELNTDTGEWYYACVPALPGASLALDDRLAMIEPPGRKR